MRTLGPRANADERNLLAELNAAIDDDGEDGRLSTGSRPARQECSLVERGDEGLVEQIREQNSLWYRVRRHAGVSVVSTTFVPHGGSCVSPQNRLLVHNPS